jgi:membrane associated rhomboid family serine protease
LEAQTDITTFLSQGKQALAQGNGHEAAIAYAHGAQIEPENPLVHLGLAEANLALGSPGIVLLACRKTQDLVAEGPIYHLAQALLDLLEQHYDAALRQTDSALTDDPGNGYAHALRAYLLRATNQTYDAGLARARASRLSFGGTFANCFPPLEPVSPDRSQPQPTLSQTVSLPEPAARSETSSDPQRQQYEQIPPWSRTSRQRQMIRTRFWMSQHPRFLTSLLITITALGFLLFLLLNQLPAFVLLLQNVFGRFVLSIFMPGSILQLAFNALSLFFVGSTVEMLYGKWRYLVIYLVSGIVGNVVLAVVVPGFFLAGATGAIFGIFGALGAFFIVQRRALGPTGNAMIGQWVFWLLLNLFLGSAGGTGLPLLFGGLITGIVLGLILMRPLRRTGRRVS